MTSTTQLTELWSQWLNILGFQEEGNRGKVVKAEKIKRSVYDCSAESVEPSNEHEPSLKLHRVAITISEIFFAKSLSVSSPECV
ncbi:hypothetical protein HMI54_004205 [Coelomomyces lativittatus]|nr:hypothetical protein HMI54_004205 [Coelomomyces lativittatus]KAJ1513484.1 hypothetical protein HMI56_002381 [Coelomomyces lativittatus]